MKVFFIGAASLDRMRGDTMEAHIVSALQAMGNKVSYFPYVTGALGFRLNRIFDRAMTDLKWIKSTPADHFLSKAARAFQPDLVLVLLGNYTSPETIRNIRDITRAPIACWCQDHIGTMGRQYLIGSKFDFIFAKDQLLVDRLRNFTSHTEAHYLPEACNPEMHRTVTLTTSDIDRFACDVTTAASLYYYRSEILESISDFDLRIWGPVPKYYDGPLRCRASGLSVHTHEKSACFNAAKIVINSLFPVEIGGLNARAFEVAGCGGFQMITHSDAIDRHFSLGKEIVSFRNLKDLRDKLTYFLTHDDERIAIAKAGQTRAHAEHTYEKRLTEMMAVMRLS